MNRHILQAPEGKFRVVGVDTFDGTDWIDGDFDTKEEAISSAAERGKNAQMMKLHVYDDRGNHLYEDGKF
jgi:hypothetical protein